MPRAVVDANVIIAARLAGDTDHERGLSLTSAIDQGRLPRGVVLNDVLAEVYNYLHARADHEVARETLDALVESSGYEIVFTAKTDFDTARSVARQYDRLSLTDAVIVAYMQREALEYLYSFDDGFDGVEGITRLVTPENPYEPSDDG